MSAREILVPILKARQLPLFTHLDKPTKQVLVRRKSGKTHMQRYHVRGTETMDDRESNLISEYDRRMKGLDDIEENRRRESYRQFLKEMEEERKKRQEEWENSEEGQEYIKREKREKEREEKQRIANRNERILKKIRNVIKYA